QRPPVIRPLPGQVRPTTPTRPTAPTPAAAAPVEAVGEPTLTVEEGPTPGEDTIILNMPNAPLESALDLYATLVDRVLLRPPQLAGGPINLKFDNLTREEAIEAMNAVFALNNISVIPV